MFHAKNITVFQEWCYLHFLIVIFPFIYVNHITCTEACIRIKEMILEVEEQKEKERAKANKKKEAGSCGVNGKQTR